MAGNNLSSIRLDIFDDCDDSFQPTTEELLELWEESCIENGLSQKNQPSHVDLMKLWDEACSEYKIKTVMATADQKTGMDAGEPSQDITTDELKAAFNQAFEDLNGKDFDTAKADSVAVSKAEKGGKHGKEDKITNGSAAVGPASVRMRDIFANLLKRR